MRSQFEQRFFWPGTVRCTLRSIPCCRSYIEETHFLTGSDDISLILKSDGTLILRLRVCRNGSGAEIWRVTKLPKQWSLPLDFEKLEQILEHTSNSNESLKTALEYIKSAGKYVKIVKYSGKIRLGNGVILEQSNVEVKISGRTMLFTSISFEKGSTENIASSIRAIVSQECMKKVLQYGCENGCEHNRSPNFECGSMNYPRFLSYLSKQLEEF
eukprot:TRINITY_DN4397_c0_g1_i1.p1 TRINITY_DN4397_c0_g1~~TRINITY_DN4397_c0_g1_i1.p1  ORF type:complete len:214 (-),score=19.85 TRINITY_DN4397_c0_g1_i1:62-703(-)